MELRAVAGTNIRKQVENLARSCQITPKNQHRFVEEVLATITRYKMQDFKSSLKSKK